MNVPRSLKYSKENFPSILPSRENTIRDGTFENNNVDGGKQFRFVTTLQNPTGIPGIVIVKVLFNPETQREFVKTWMG